MNNNLSTDFYFSPDGKVHQLHRERLLILFGGQRALLMQLAHPLVAQGVLDHSSVRENSLKRLNRTLELIQSFIYGTNDEVARAAARINSAHAAIKGTLPQKVGAHDANTSYRAFDPELLTWVWATLADTAILTYETFIGFISDAEKESYYQEYKKLLVPLGGKIETVPSTFKDLGDYLSRMNESKKIMVSKSVRNEIVPYLLLRRPKRLRLPLLPLSWSLEKITTGLLSPELRLQYGVSWSNNDQRLFNAFAASSRKIHGSQLVALIPGNLRYTKYYRRSLLHKRP